MRLYLIRHGIAIDREDPACPPEEERFLTRAGTLRTRQAMKGLARLGARPDVILTSPYVRAVQTAEIAARELRVAAKRLHTTQALLPGAEPARLLDEMGTWKGKEVACCGHAPNLDEIIACAVGAPSVFTALKKAGVACIEWSSRQAGGGELLWLVPAGLLRRLTG